MLDGVEHGRRCNGQISLVIFFNPLNTHNMTAGQKINTQRPNPLLFFPLRLPPKTKNSFSPCCCAYTLKHRSARRRNKLRLDGKHTGKRRLKSFGLLSEPLVGVSQTNQAADTTMGCLL